MNDGFSHVVVTKVLFLDNKAITTPLFSYEDVLHLVEGDKGFCLFVFLRKRLSCEDI